MESTAEMGGMSGAAITAVIKARNEARQIGDCIASLNGFATHILVVDDASTDDTAARAQAAGATVIPAQSQAGRIDELDRLGFTQVDEGWILRLDADERMTPTLAEKLKAIAANDNAHGVWFARMNILFGGWVRHGGWFLPNQLRFFRADAWDKNWDCAPHSHPQVTGAVLTLPAREEYATLHLNYDSIPQFVERTLLRYARLEAETRYAHGERFSAWKLLGRPLRRFCGRYIIRQGFRDGARGLILAGLLAAYDFLIAANLWDLARQEERA
ncbi:MAG: glycosyltransferase family 2 protein [Alphaproteobacteria bacterium]|nr:glycosyltransferase family 2 protein [Alphaproteobacteria bacterium]